MCGAYEGAARHVRRFGLEPNIALCSQSQFGNHKEGSGKRLRDALEILDSRNPDFCYEGEMNVDVALDPELRQRIFPRSRMQGAANVLVFAHADAASGVARMRSWREVLNVSRQKRPTYPGLLA